LPPPWPWHWPAFPRRICKTRPAPHGQIALTFDDLPGINLADDSAYIEAFSRRLVAGLKRNHAPVTAFVVPGKLDDLDRKAMVHVAPVAGGRFPAGQPHLQP
jgi:peptidoglycan/xylan/chitin deacetylase (PgdA/CDA1 family)